MATAKKTARSTDWRKIVASSLGWGQAHATLAAAVDRLPVALRGQRPKGLPHCAWELLEHIRRTQADLVDFMTNPNYVAREWPKDYWPASPVPPSPRAWNETLRAIEHDRATIAKLATKPSLDLTKQIPWGDGQTYLRTILVAQDHESYHTAQIIFVRRLLGAWKDA